MTDNEIIKDFECCYNTYFYSRHKVDGKGDAQ